MTEETFELDGGLEELETVATGGTGTPVITSIVFDVGYKNYVEGSQEDHFYSLTKLGKDDALDAYREAYRDTHGGDSPARWQENVHLNIRFSLDDIKNRGVDDLPNWQEGRRIIQLPLTTSSPSDKQLEGWVPYAYEKFRDESIGVVMDSLGLEASREILGRTIWAAYRMEPDEWEYWQIQRAQAGERTQKRFAKEDAAEKVNWVPVFVEVFETEEAAIEASKDSGDILEIPSTPENWNEEWASFRAYYSEAYRTAKEPGMTLEGMVEAFVIYEDDDTKETEVFTTEMVNNIWDSATAEPKEDEIPF